MAAALDSYVSESVAFLVVAGLVVLLASFAARRVGVPRALGPVELLARLPLEARRSVYVVRVVDRVLIIGSSEAGLTKLGELPKNALGEAGLGPGNGGAFSRLLDGLWRNPKNPPRGAAAVGYDVEDAALAPDPTPGARRPGSEEGG